MKEKKQRGKSDGKRKKSGVVSTVLLIIILLVSLSLLLYPTVSNWWNSFHQSQGIASYNEATDELDEAARQEMWDAAAAYNEKLAQSGVNWFMSEEEEEEYQELLDVTGTGIMSYIEIPVIDVMLPIYHGTDDSVLQIAAGHLSGSSLPVGGESTHCIISGHRGLPSAILFSDLDELVEGDIFILHTLGETLTYEVDQIRIVEPDELDELEIIEGEDLCTLVTCTPYGVNSHRLLVRGHRVENRTENLVSMDATQIKTIYVAGVIAAILLFLLLILLLITTRRKRGGRSRMRKERESAAAENTVKSGKDPDQESQAGAQEREKNPDKENQEHTAISGENPGEEDGKTRQEQDHGEEAGRMNGKQNTGRKGTVPSVFFSAAILSAALLLVAMILAAVLAFWPGLRAQAKELPDLDAAGSITVELVDSGTGSGLSGGSLELYLLAEAETEDADYWWSYTGAFETCAYSLDDLTSKTLPSALADYVSANGISPRSTAVTGEDGSAVFSNLPVGLYLIVQSAAVDGYETMDPFLVTVPLENEEDGSWIYDVDAKPKMSAAETEDTSALTLVKETTSTPADGEAYALGETITYKITVTNTGSVTITDIMVEDALTGRSGDNAWTVDSLAAGESVEFTTAYMVTEADILAGSVVNEATVNGTPENPADSPDEESVSVTPTDPEEGITEDPTQDPDAVMTLVKETTSTPADGEAYVLGEEITYRITVTNTGNVTLTDVAVEDALTGNTGENALTAESLAPGESIVFNVSHTVTESDILSGSVINEATASAIMPYVETSQETYEDSKGTVTPENPEDGRTEDPTADKTADQTENTVPQTGDGTPVSMWFSLLLLSAAVLLAMGVRKHRER